MPLYINYLFFHYLNTYKIYMHKNKSFFIPNHVSFSRNPSRELTEFTQTKSTCTALD